jgi:hypothetical protein
MKVILPLGSDPARSVAVIIRPARAILVWIWVLLTGVGLAILFTGTPSDLLLSGFAVGIALLVAGFVIYCHPHVFDILTFRLPGVFVLSYSLMILLPLPFIYTDYAYPARKNFLLATTVSFVCTLVGIILMHYCFPSSPKGVQRWLSKPFCIPMMLKIVSVILLVLCIGIFILYIKQVGSLPLLQAIRGGRTALELALAREAALKLIPGRIVYVYTLNRNVLFPYTTLLLLVLAIALRSWRWKLLFGVSLAVNMFLAAATLEKTPVAALVIMLALAWLLARGQKPSFAKMLPVAVVAFVFPVFVYLAAYQFNIDARRVVSGIVRRLLYLPGEVLYHYFSYFPDRHDFLFGRTLPYISKLYIDGPFPILNTICLYMQPETPLRSCFANAAFAGFSWANFGWAGIVIGSFSAGMAIQGVQVLIMCLPKSVSTIVFQAMFSYFTTILSYTSLGDLLDPAGRGFVIILTLLIVLVSECKRDDETTAHPSR